MSCTELETELWRLVAERKTETEWRDVCRHNEAEARRDAEIANQQIFALDLQIDRIESALEGTAVTGSAMTYGVILADPPWRFVTYSPKSRGRSADAHYDTMSFAELAALPIANLAARDCALFLWVPGPHLPRGLELMVAWGFKHVATGFTWAKLNKRKPGYWRGTGYWTRKNTEICLQGSRGKPKPLPTHTEVDELIVEPRREHSRKPDRVRADIQRLVAGPYCELFSRSSAAGWDVAFSNEAGLFDNGPVKTRRIPS